MALPTLKSLPQSPILYRAWEVKNPKALILLVHGMGAHSARWDFLAQYFLKLGYACWAPELPGFGATTGPRGHADSFQVYDQTVLAMQRHVRARFPKQKLFLLGESLGGLIACRAAELHPELFSGLICISPAFANAMKFKITDYLVLPLALLFAPRYSLQVPFTAAMCTRDQAYQRVMEKNPLELRTASAKLLINTLLEQGRCISSLSRIACPVLFLLAGRDFLVSPQAARRAFQRLAPVDKQLIDYPEMLHALSIDLGRERVFKDIAAWLQGRIKP